MNNNDILRRLRFSFEYSDQKMIELFALADVRIAKEQIKKWLKKEDDAEFSSLSDTLFATFLNGLIYQNRGKQDDKTRPPEKSLNNNIILNKLKIALNLRAEEIIAMLESVNFTLSKPELSALFRKPEHQHYRECKDQVLRNFLQAIQNKYRQSPLPKNNDTMTHQRQGDDKVINHKTARPNASKAYVNPKASSSKKQSERKVLKLKPEDIWK